MWKKERNIGGAPAEKAILSPSVTAPIKEQVFHQCSTWLKENRLCGSVVVKKRQVCRHVTVHITSFRNSLLA